MEYDVNLLDKIKSIADKELAFNNAIKELNYQKVKSVLEKNPEFLLPKHVSLVENIAANKDLTLTDKENLNLINKEVNYQSEKLYAGYYAYANDLKFDNANIAMRSELSTDPPCNKEPLIHYIANGADVTMLNNENLNKKLQDLAIYEIGGKKVLEQDKKELIQFATLTAIKNDDIGAYKHLDKEFDIKMIFNEDLHSVYKYASLNQANDIKEHITPQLQLNGLYKTPIDLENDNSFKNKTKIESVLETKKLIVAIENNNVPQIEKAVSNGANVSYNKIHQSINKLDDEAKSKVVFTIYNGVKERNDKLPSNLKWKFDFKETLKLQEAAVKGNAISAYNAIKNGADTKGITKENYNHLPSSDKKLFENAIYKAVNELSNRSLDIKNNNNLKL